MRHSRLATRMFILAAPVLILFSVGVYAFSVPLIRSTAFQIEENAGRTILNNVFDLALRIQLDLERHRAIALDARRHELRTVVDLAHSYGEQFMSEYRAGHLTYDEARAQFFDKLRGMLYGQNGYIWVANYEGILVSHPDPEFHGVDLSDLKFQEGKNIVQAMVKTAIEDGEGYMSYDWRRLGHPEESQKLSYFRNFPDWKVVIGSGVYVDDVAQDVERRRQASIDELRDVLRHIQIAKTGYLYIFDSNFNMVIHPNPNIEGTNFADAVDPLSKMLIGPKLIAMADKPEGLIYKWDKPSEPGRYIYDKVAWVRHFAAFDWYIASSVYVEELQRSAEILRNRIFVISILGFLLAAILMSLFIRQITQPISKLAKTAEKVQSGDLTAQSNLRRDDEFGLLSRAFDAMINQVRGNIDTLDNKVRERTSALEEANLQLTDAIRSKESARQALSMAEKRQRLILDAIPSYVGYFGKKRELLFANKEYSDQIAKKGKIVAGMKFEDTLPHDFVFNAMEFLNRAFGGETVVFLSEHATSDVDLELRKNMFIPEIAHDDSVSGVFFISRDITEEKRAEQQLMEAQRISAAGQLAGGLAHDFNNLLSVIIGNLSGAREQFHETPDLDSFLEPAYRASKRGADITARLLAFSRKQPLKPSALDLNLLTRETISLLRSSISGNIDIDLRCPDDRCEVFADPSQLENALVNLILNARDAMQKGGTLVIEASSIASAGARDFDEPVAPGDYGLLRVADSGPGFSADALERGFEPFFSTKHDRGGTGLGLSMVYGFVKQSGGYLRIGNKPQGGAEVVLLLPHARAASASGARSASRAEGETAHWRGKLALLVEDDPDVRRVARRYLVDLGFHVLESSNGDDALSLLETLEDISVLVSDVVMPSRIDGLELARRTRETRPEISILLMTGYAPSIEANENPFVILRKPFSKNDLAEGLHKAIDTSLIREVG